MNIFFQSAGKLGPPKSIASDGPDDITHRFSFLSLGGTSVGA